MSKKVEIDYNKLYDKSTCFRLYVDKHCASYDKSKEEAFEDLLVKSYANYILSDAPQGVINEVKEDYGC